MITVASQIVIHPRIVTGEMDHVKCWWELGWDHVIYYGQYTVMKRAVKSRDSDWILPVNVSFSQHSTVPLKLK